MNLIRQNRRLSALVLALVALGGLVAWRLSGTAQAPRPYHVAPRALADVRPGQTPHFRRLRAGPIRVQPGGRMRSTACFVIKAGFDGSPVLILPVDSPAPALADCRAVCVNGSPNGRTLEVFGGNVHEALPAELWHHVVPCGSVRLPPGYAVPLGH
jgi:hypothetical protein